MKPKINIFLSLAGGFVFLREIGSGFEQGSLLVPALLEVLHLQLLEFLKESNPANGWVVVVISTTCTTATALIRLGDSFMYIMVSLYFVSYTLLL